ncbi:MAG TPA: cytochrome c-type biogenesis protein [Alphaproteobacteria bacterium]
MKFFLSCAKIILLACFLINPAWAQPRPVSDRDIENITTDLRCLTCPNENITESTSPMALDVKNYIRERLSAGDDKDQILKVLTGRYGEELHYKPVWAYHTLLLWLTPLLALACGALMIVRIFKKDQA